LIVLNELGVVRRRRRHRHAPFDSERVEQLSLQIGAQLETKLREIANSNWAGRAKLDDGDTRILTPTK
jgi:hypothetical protein